MANATSATSEPIYSAHRSISWSAVFAGALVATGLGFLLHLFTTGLGLSSVTTDSAGMTSLAIGGFIWLLVTGYFSMFIAGWVSGILAQASAQSHAGLLHGFTTWCIALIISIILATHASALINAAATPLHGMNISAPTATAQPANTHTASTMEVTADGVSMTDDQTNTPQATDNSQASNTSQGMTDAQKTSNDLGKGILATFFIFLVGAIGSCMGGYYGIQNKKMSGNSLSSK